MKLFWLAGGVALALLGLIMTAQAAHAVEEPQWRLVYEDGPFAIRDYAPTIVAETRIGGERVRPSIKAFAVSPGIYSARTRPIAKSP